MTTPDEIDEQLRLVRIRLHTLVSLRRHEALTETEETEYDRLAHEEWRLLMLRHEWPSIDVTPPADVEDSSAEGPAQP